MGHSRLKQTLVLVTTHKQRVFAKAIFSYFQQGILNFLGVNKKIEGLTGEVERLKLKVEVLQGELKLSQNPNIFEEKGFQIVRAPQTRKDHSKINP